jgi:hypothetical protein
VCLVKSLVSLVDRVSFFTTKGIREAQASLVFIGWSMRIIVPFVEGWKIVLIDAKQITYAKTNKK